MSNESERKTYAIVTNVVDKNTKKGIGGLRVEAWDKDLILDDFIGQAVTDEEGSCILKFDERALRDAFADRHPELYFKIFRGDELIVSTESSLLWNIQTGESELRIEVDVQERRKEERPLTGTFFHIVDFETDPFPVWGVIVESDSNLPLPNCKVRMRYLEPMTQPNGIDSHAHNKHAFLGEALTDNHGRFSIAYVKNEAVRQRLFLLRSMHSASYELTVTSETGQTLYNSDPLNRSSSLPLSIKIRLSYKAPGRARWAMVGEQLEEARIAQLHQVVNSLILPSNSGNLFPNLSTEQRYSMVADLEKAFLDPTGVLNTIVPLPRWQTLKNPSGLLDYKRKLTEATEDTSVSVAFAEMSVKLQKFYGLQDVDWVIDIEMLKKAEPGKAIANVQPDYKVDEGFAFPDRHYFKADQQMISYRNYLRNIYTGAANSADYHAHKETLQRRFHQDFTTNDTHKRCANEGLMLIVKSILTSPKADKYGFNIAETSIDPQGDLTPREYLDYLISLSNLSAEHLGLRYRLKLNLPDSAQSSRVQQNIDTLLLFYQDGFQSVSDPYPIIPDDLHGKAPFFLHFNEWQRKYGPFYAENFFPLKQTYHINILNSEKGVYENRATATDTPKNMLWYLSLVGIQDTLGEARNAVNNRQYTEARNLYMKAQSDAGVALGNPAWFPGKSAISTTDIMTQLDPLLEEMSVLPMSNDVDLESYVDAYQIPYVETLAHAADFDPWFENKRLKLLGMVFHLYTVVIPVCLGDLALETGDYEAAIEQYELSTRFLLSRAETDSHAGYPGYNGHLVFETWKSGRYYKDGQLPYSTPRFLGTVDPVSSSIWGGINPDNLAHLHVTGKFHNMERNFLKLRHANAMLEWADALYRTDDASTIQRAREIYKAVLWIHGIPPAISPSWYFAKDHFKFGDHVFVNHTENPAMLAQRDYARKNLFQIDNGLNFYGSNNALVPTLRYKPLKDAGDSFAGAAKSAQQDFLIFVGNIEEAMRDNIISANMLKKAEIMGKIAQEQQKIAEYGVKVAEQQVAQVEAAIAAKKSEIEDHDGFWNELGDFLGGMTGAIGGLAGLASGSSTSSSSALGLLGTGGGVLSAYGAFVQAGYTSLTSMGESQNERRQQLRALREQVLPMAKEQVQAKQREVTIAQLQQQAAGADADLANELLRFQVTRFLNMDFWADLATLMNRIMKRYLDLGARYAWLAERALAYEQNRPIDIIRFAYNPKELQGVTGADLLQADLSELEATRINGFKQTVPIKRTYSLAFDFPLAVWPVETNRALRFHDA